MQGTQDRHEGCVTCTGDTRVSNLRIGRGFWRLGNASTQLLKCEGSNSTTTPCDGGLDAGYLGNGYCVANHTGLRCEVCVPDWYFDKGIAECRSCDEARRVAGVFCGVVFGLVAFFCILYKAYLASKPMLYAKDGEGEAKTSALRRVTEWVYTFLQFSDDAGLIAKAKQTLAFYQVVRILESTYTVEMPRQWNQFTGFFSVFGIEFSGLFNPYMACWGGWYHVLSWYAGFPFILFGIIIGVNIFRARVFRRKKYFVRFGLMQALPLLLVITFTIVTIVSNKIFSTFDCENVQLDGERSIRYLRTDVSVECTTEHGNYDSILGITWVFFAIWPVGVTVLYLILLYIASPAINGKKTHFNIELLAQATNFLHKEYDPAFYWWEPVDILRRLTLTGLVLLIAEDQGMMRLMVGLLVSFAFLILVMATQPYKRTDDILLATCIHAILVMLFLGGLIMKACDRHQQDICQDMLGIHDTFTVSVIMVCLSIGILVLCVVMVAYRLRQAYLRSRVLTEEELDMIIEVTSSRTEAKMSRWRRMSLVVSSSIDRVSSRTRRFTRTPQRSNRFSTFGFLGPRQRTSFDDGDTPRGDRFALTPRGDTPRDAGLEAIEVKLDIAAVQPGAVDGSRIMPDQPATSAVDGSRIMPDQPATTAVDGSRIMPDQTATTAVDGSRIMPDQSATTAVEGTRIMPEGIDDSGNDTDKTTDFTAPQRAELKAAKPHKTVEVTVDRGPRDNPSDTPRKTDPLRKDKRRRKGSGKFASNAKELVTGKLQNITMGIHHFMSVPDPLAEGGVGRIKEEIATLVRVMRTSHDADPEKFADTWRNATWSSPQATGKDILNRFIEETQGNLNYILYAKTVEREFHNGTRDKGRGFEAFVQLQLEMAMQARKLAQSGAMWGSKSCNINEDLEERSAFADFFKFGAAKTASQPPTQASVPKLETIPSCAPHGAESDATVFEAPPPISKFTEGASKGEESSSSDMPPTPPVPNSDQQDNHLPYGLNPTVLSILKKVQTAETSQSLANSIEQGMENVAQRRKAIVGGKLSSALDAVVDDATAVKAKIGKMLDFNALPVHMSDLTTEQLRALRIQYDSLTEEERAEFGVSLANFCHHPKARASGLTDAHVVALRLYTTHAFKYINHPLRDVAHFYNVKQPHPLPNTVAFISDGIKKLRAVYTMHLDDPDAPKHHVPNTLWRGMKGMRVTDAFMEGNLGGTELAPMSTTTDLQVAVEYGMSAQSLLFKFKVDNFLGLGADLQWLSAFPGEAEVLYPPLTYLKPTGRQQKVAVGKHNFRVVEIVPHIP